MVGGVGTRRSAAHFVHENDLHMQEGGACGGLLFLCFFPAPRALNPPICFAVWLLQRANILRFRVSGCLSVTNTLFSLYTLPSGSKGPKREAQHSNNGDKEEQGVSLP